MYKKQKNIKSLGHLSIFKNDTDDSKEDEEDDYDCGYEQTEAESTKIPLEDQPSTSSSYTKQKPVDCDSQSDSSNTDSSSDEYLPFDDVCDPTNSLDELENMSQSIFARFESWLKGPDAGRKDDHCARQCARQVQLVVHPLSLIIQS